MHLIFRDRRINLIYEGRRELLRKDRDCSAEKQTPKTSAHGRRKEEAEKKMKDQCAFGARERSSGLGN